MSIVLGVDPSLTSTGLARVDTDDHLVIDVATVTSKPGNQPGIEGRVQRLARICQHVIAFADLDEVDLLVIEAPAFSSRSGQQHDRSGLWWRLIDRALDHGCQVVEVAPTSRAKYATGKGNAGKDEVLLAVAKRYPHVDVTNNNEADALVLAAMGAHLVGHPIDELPKTHLDALTKVRATAGRAVA